MDPSELELVRSSMRHLLGSATAADFPTRLVDDGWEALVEDDPAAAIGILGEEIGRSRSAAPLLDLAVRHGAGLGVDPRTAVVFPMMRRGAPLTSATIDGDRLVVDGLLLAGHERATRFVVASDAGLFEVDPAALTFGAMAAGDPELGLATARGDVTVGESVAPPEAWTAALAEGRLALAAVLIGSASQMLDDTLGYVRVRHQYGRPIGSFQTVKHRLADVHVAIAAARAGTETAWADDTDLSAMAAAVLAIRAQHLAATHCHQVHGGIAFTVEHGFHRFIRRGQVVSGLLGHPDDLVRLIGRRLVTGGKVPRTPQLG